MRNKATIDVTLKPNHRDPEGTWKEMWEIANEIAQKRGKNCMKKSSTLLEKATKARYVTSNWVPNDYEEHELQNKIETLQAIFKHFDYYIQNQNLNKITPDDWTELEVFLSLTKI